MLILSAFIAFDAMLLVLLNNYECHPFKAINAPKTPIQERTKIPSLKMLWVLASYLLLAPKAETK